MNSIIDHVLAGANYGIEVVDRFGVAGQHELVKNLIPVAGLTHIAGAVFKAVSSYGSWYLAPYEGNYTPTSADTAATIAANAVECTAYDETTRVLWNTGTVVAGALDNSANKAEFTMNATKTLYGAYLISAPTKAATTGVLVSIVRFSSPKMLDPGSVLRITAGFGFTSA